MGQDTFDVAVAGHICLDIIPRFHDTGARALGDIITPGKLVNVGPVAVATGGPVSNTGIGLHILGMNVRFMTKVGDDAFGTTIIERLGERASAEGVTIEAGGHTSYTVALAPPGIDRVFLHHPGTNDTFASRDVDFDLVARARHFHLGYPPLMNRLFAGEGAELARIFRQAKSTGATTSLDMSLPDPDSDSGRAPWFRILERTLPHVDVFLPSIEEAVFMMQRDRFLEMKSEHGGAELIDFFTVSDYTDLAGRFIELGSRIVGLKSGHRGFYVKTADVSQVAGMGRARPADVDNWSDRELWAPAYRVDPIASATGSGDSSIAGFLAAMLRNETIERTLQFANTAGSLNLTRLDAISGLRDWTATADLVADAGREMISFPLDAPAWRYDHELRMWKRR